MSDRWLILGNGPQSAGQLHHLAVRIPANQGIHPDQNSAAAAIINLPLNRFDSVLIHKS